VKAALTQLLGSFKPSAGTSAGPSAAGSVGETALMQVLEQQTLLMQRLTDRPVGGNDDALARIVEQQGQLLERLNARSSVTVREFQVKLPVIKLPSFDGNIEEWKRYSDTLKH